MRLSPLAFAAVVALPHSLAAQAQRAPNAAARGAAVEYAIAFPNAAHHEAEVAVTFRAVPPGALQLRMSRSSPGRYALHEFAKNVYALKAVDSKGRALTVTRPNPHQWDVRGHDGTVKVTYTLFGDRGDGTYAGIDRSMAHPQHPGDLRVGTRARVASHSRDVPSPRFLVDGGDAALPHEGLLDLHRPRTFSTSWTRPRTWARSPGTSGTRPPMASHRSCASRCTTWAPPRRRSALLTRPGRS
jgi:hypothetical protein